jgi:hypothetical protein
LKLSALPRAAATASWNFSRASEYELLKLSAPIIHFSQSFHSVSLVERNFGYAKK